MGWLTFWNVDVLGVDILGVDILTAVKAGLYVVLYLKHMLIAPCCWALPSFLWSMPASGADTLHEHKL